jgi:hypothetical protein
MDREQLWNDIEFLSQYEELECSGWGEMIGHLCRLAGRIDYISDELAEMVAKEISDNVAYVKENAKIVTRTETFTKTFYDIEWSDH